MIYNFLDSIGIETPKRYYFDYTFIIKDFPDIIYWFPIFFDVRNESEAFDLRTQILRDVFTNRHIIVKEVTSPILVSQSEYKIKKAEIERKLGSSSQIYDINIITLKKTGTKKTGIPHPFISEELVPLVGNREGNATYKPNKIEKFQLGAFSKKEITLPVPLTQIEIVKPD